ncbi:MAG: GH92 family glycosyl hydrolase [Chitinophagaceae bacterium]
MNLKRFLLIIIILSSCIAHAQTGSNVKYIDPTIGAVGHILEPTRPAVHLPNSMVRVFPVRKDQLDDQIKFFPLTISSHRQPNLFGIMGFSNEKEYGIKGYTWDNEIATPYYYSVRLEDSGDSIEFVPAERSGFFRFHYADNGEHFIRFHTVNPGRLQLEGKRAVSGVESYQDLTAYFYAELDTDIQEGASFEDTTQRRLILQLNKNVKHAGVRYGISFISKEQARQNLQKEIPDWDFQQVKRKAFFAWDKVMSQINVEGGTLAQKRVFYTSLYRSYERMVNINEYGRYYSAYDRKVHNSSKPFYVDNWLWDTYIALEPLQTILNPGMQADKINSYINMYEQSGWMPSFALAFGDNPCMTGNHAATWIADSWVKGIRDFNLESALEGLKKNSLQATLLPWRNGPATSLDSFYNRHGYFPALHPGENEWVREVNGFEKRQSVSVTLENSYSDWCIAFLLRQAKDKAGSDLFMQRAGFYKNVFRQDKGFMWPKDSTGKWIEPFDPKFSGGQGGRHYTTENNVYTYNWDVKHDLQGLFTLMGGHKKAEAKLDDLFRQNLGRSKYELWNTFPDATGLVGQFVMGNEPSFHIPYLYNYTGAPWKTQKRIRMLLDTWFTDNLFGIPGDEDGGGMTAFVVFSMMGFFPVTPGVPVYNIGSPVFEKITVNLPGGKKFSVVAKNNSTGARYIQSAKLNGKNWEKAWFTHRDLVAGAVLELQMGEIPNKQWGSKGQDAPPSAMDIDPATF